LSTQKGVRPRGCQTKVGGIPRTNPFKLRRNTMEIVGIIVLVAVVGFVYHTFFIKGK